MSDETKTYTVDVACRNCGYVGQADLKARRAEVPA